MRRFGQMLSPVDVLSVVRAQGLLGAATACQHSWSAACKRFQVDDLSVQSRFHLALSTTVLLRRLIDAPVLSLRSDYQQHAFGFSYDVSLYCEAKGQAVRGYAVKNEAVQKAERPPVLIVEYSGRKDVTQLSESANGLLLDDVQSYCRTLGIHIQYCFDSDRRFAFLARTEQPLAPLHSLKDLKMISGTEVTEEQFHYGCPCSRESVYAFVKRMPKPALEDLIASGGRMACKFCNEMYQWPLEELDALLGDPYKRFLGL